jgi:hypothetical protein
MKNILNIPCGDKSVVDVLLLRHGFKQNGAYVNKL